MLFLLVLVDFSCETGVCGVEGGEDGQEKAHYGVNEQQHYIARTGKGYSCNCNFKHFCKVKSGQN